VFQVQVKMEHLVFQPKNHQNLVEFSSVTWFKYLRDQNQIYLTILNIVNCKDEVFFSTNTFHWILTKDIY